MWQACNNAIPTGMVLHRRISSINDACLACGFREDTLHALLGYPRVVSVWESLDFGLFDQLCPSCFVSFIDWWVMREELCRVAFIFWEISNGRNEAMFGRDQGQHHDVVVAALHY